MRTERTVNNGQKHLVRWYCSNKGYLVQVQIKSVIDLVCSAYKLLKIPNVGLSPKDMSILAEQSC